MKRICCVLFLFLIMNMILFGQTPQKYVPGVVLVKFNKNVLPVIKQDISKDEILSNELKTSLEKVAFKNGKKIFKSFSPGDTLGIDRNGNNIKLIDLSRWYRLEISDTINVNSFSEKLVKLPGIIAAAPDHILQPNSVFPNDPRFIDGYQWGLHNYNSPGTDIHAPAAWELNKGRNDVVVAVVDGGVDYNHDDLDSGDRSRVIQGKDTGDDDDDPMDNLPSSSDWAGHGTSVAGVIGAITNNNLKVAGVMWNCQIMPVKVASNDGYGIFGWGAGEAFNSDIGAGIDYARTHSADVINMSFGGQGPGWWEELIIGNPVRESTWNAYQQGIVLVAAMGNDGDNTVSYPAGFDWTIAVGATDQSDNRAYFSNYGSHINIMAPGVSYYTTERSQSEGYFSGTSCATPVVSGVAGLIISESRDLGLNFTNDDVMHLIEKSADDKGSFGWDPYYGYGRINAEKALKYLNPPYTVTHGTKVSTNKTLFWDSHGHTFFDNAGLASGKYWDTKVYKVTAHIDFPHFYKDVPMVWIRERESNGWSAANPNLELPYFNITNVTKTGFDVETFIYYVGQRLGEGCECNYWPGNPNYAEAVFSYTVIGEMAPLSVNISGPTWLDNYVYGTFTANPSGGSGSYVDYKWWSRNDEGIITPLSLTGGVEPNAPNVGVWYPVSSWDGLSTVTPGYNWDFSLKCEVTDSEGQTATDIHSVIVGSPLLAASQQNGEMAISAVPEEFSLQGNYPNPFNPVTTIRFGLPEAANVKLVVYSVTGAKVATLVDSYLSEGFHEAQWNGLNQAGARVASGIYIYELISGEKRFIKKMLLAK